MDLSIDSVLQRKQKFSAPSDAVHNCFKFKDTCLKVPFFQTKSDMIFFLHWGEVLPDLISIFIGMNYIACIFKLLCFVYFFETENSMHWNIPIKRYPPSPSKWIETSTIKIKIKDIGVNHEKEFKWALSLRRHQKSITGEPWYWAECCSGNGSTAQRCWCGYY